MTMHNTTVETHEAVHCWWIFLHLNLVKVIVALICLYVDKKRISTRKCRRLATEASVCSEDGGVLPFFGGLSKPTAGSLKALAGSATPHPSDTAAVVPLQCLLPDERHTSTFIM